MGFGLARERGWVGGWVGLEGGGGGGDTVGGGLFGPAVLELDHAVLASNDVSICTAVHGRHEKV